MQGTVAEPIRWNLMQYHAYLRFTAEHLPSPMPTDTARAAATDAPRDCHPGDPLLFFGAKGYIDARNRDLSHKPFPLPREFLQETRDIQRTAAQLICCRLMQHRAYRWFTAGHLLTPLAACGDLPITYKIF